MLLALNLLFNCLISINLLSQINLKFKNLLFIFNFACFFLCFVVFKQLLSFIFHFLKITYVFTQLSFDYFKQIWIFAWKPFFTHLLQLLLTSFSQQLVLYTNFDIYCLIFSNFSFKAWFLVQNQLLIIYIITNVLLSLSLTLLSF